MGRNSPPLTHEYMGEGNNMNLAAIRTDKISAVKEHALGDVYKDASGRTFVYAKAGATALSRGKLTVAADPVANHQDMSFAVAPAVGDTKIQVTLGATAATADQYRDGWMVVNDGTGEGRAYPVEGNAAADSAATCIVYLKEGIDTAGALSEANVNLIPGKWNGTVISAADQADMPTGVPNVAVTAAYYYWSQVGGPCAVLADETLSPVGGVVTIGSSTAGAVEELDAVAEPVVGEVMIAGVDGEYPVINLQIHV